ncbi:MAG: hypothetical protein H0V26_12390 [Solirubrobacterales bacterium]|nr:hypothetical protein [Solirubrobacterales bacterium]
MGRALTAVALALVFCFAGLGLLVYLTRSEDRIAVDNLLAENLSRAIGTAEDQGGGRVDLASVARFKWDELVLVAPDTPRGSISRELGFEWKGDVNFGSSALFIFLEGGQVARFADYRGEGVFEGFERPFDRLERDAAGVRVRNLTISP